jgi:hypothetical protein
MRFADPQRMRRLQERMLSRKRRGAIAIRTLRVTEEIGC